MRRFLTSLPCFTLLAAAPHLYAADAMTLRDFVLRVTTQGPQMVVSYCGKAMPKLKKEMDAEFQSLQKKIDAAAEPLMQQLSAEQNPEMPADSQQLFETIGAQMLEKAKQYEPTSYCPAMMANMRKASVESLRDSIEKNFARYLALAKTKPAASEEKK